MVRDNFISKTHKRRRKEIDARYTLEFKDGKASYNKGEIRILGGLSYIGLKGYLLQVTQSLNFASQITILERRSEALKDLNGWAVRNQTFSPGSQIYESHKRLSPFIRPGMLCITEEGKPRSNKLSYSVQFIDSIE